MALKNGRVNSLNVLGLRKVSFPAHHFVYTQIPNPKPGMITRIDSWINQNLNGRYYVGNSIDLINNNIVYTAKIGFEIEKELSFFTLAYSDLNK